MITWIYASSIQYIESYSRWVNWLTIGCAGYVICPAKSEWQIGGSRYCKPHLRFFWAISLSDCHGFQNSCGLRVGYAGVRVRVGFIWPSPYPYPQCGLRVTRHRLGGYLIGVWIVIKHDQHAWSCFPPLLQHPLGSTNAVGDTRRVSSPFIA